MSGVTKPFFAVFRGGADSDIVLDICHKVDKDRKVKYVWFDTGLEYFATKNHLIYLTQKYDIRILREKAKKPIPLCCKEYGQPFVSKFVSQMIEGLQRYDFPFRDCTLKEASDMVPLSYAKWWCNGYERKTKMPKQFNIEYNKGLREFLISNPPWFKISSKCCDYAKKSLSKQMIHRFGADLMITGIRKAEGGIRNFAYKTCFSSAEDSADSYRPIFWYGGDSRRKYERLWKVLHSDCYTVYGLTRTGCAGCPYNRQLQKDLDKWKEFEPGLYKAVCSIFKDSYEYTRMYHKFIKEVAL